MKIVLFLLALAACGKPYPTAPPAATLRAGCVVTDTIWRSADTVLVLTLKYPEGKCPKR